MEDNNSSNERIFNNNRMEDNSNDQSVDFNNNNQGKLEGKTIAVY